MKFEFDSKVPQRAEKMLNKVAADLDDLAEILWANIQDKRFTSKQRNEMIKTYETVLRLLGVIDSRDYLKD